MTDYDYAKEVMIKEKIDWTVMFLYTQQDIQDLQLQYGDKFLRGLIYAMIQAKHYE